MGRKYDAVLILSCKPDEKGNLTGYATSRLDTALRIFGLGETNRIALSGKSSGQMMDYLLKKGVSETHIKSEDFSLDTVGNAVFSKLELALKNNWKKIAIVSSDFHIPRTKEIFDFVYGCKFNLEYVGARYAGDFDFKEKEEKSLNKFWETFDGIKSGEDLDIISRLFECHELYKNLADKKNLMVRLMGQL